jgi:acyl carrier protein
MADFNEVYAEVKKSLIASCSLNEAEIALEKTLMEDLGVDSIDLLDLIFSLEKKFSISIEVGTLARMAAEKLEDVPFEIDNIITDEGLRILRDYIGDSQQEKLKPGLTVHEIPLLLTVRSLCNLVINRLAADGR